MVTRYERSWQFDINRAPSDNSTNLLLSKSTLWHWKALIQGEEGGATNALWTTLGTSDGVTSSLDTNDRWLSTFDETKIIRAPAGTAHSWYTGKSPAAMGPFYFTLDYSTPNDNEVTIAISKAAPTGGSITARPTAPDEWVYTDQKINDGTAEAHTFHSMLSSRGDFIFLLSKNTRARFSYSWVMQRVGDFLAPDTFPVHTYIEFAPGGVMKRQALNAQTGFWKGRDSVGGSIVEAEPTHPATTGTGIVQADANIIVFEDMIEEDATDNAFADFPIWLYTQEFGNKSIRGRLVDIVWTSTGPADGAVEPTSGSPPRSMVVGDVWVPTDTIPIL